MNRAEFEASYRSLVGLHKHGGLSEPGLVDALVQLAVHFAAGDDPEVTAKRRQLIDGEQSYRKVTAARQAMTELTHFDPKRDVNLMDVKRSDLMDAKAVPGPLGQPFRMPVVGVHLSLDQWIRLLGYLEGVGMGDEMEHHHWIQNQIRGYLDD